MKIKCFIGLLLFSINLTSFEAYAGNFTSRNFAQDSTWILNTDSGTPFSIAWNVVVRYSPPASRWIFIFVEPQNCTWENFRKIFLYLSEKYPQPSNLIVNVRSDKASLQRWIDNYIADHSIRADGSFERKKRHRIEGYGYGETEKGYYRAEYFRSEVVEDFNFSPDPNKPDLVSVLLKRRAELDATGEIIFLPSGDKNLDLVLASEFGSEDKVKELLNSGANVNAKTKQGSTPLLAAIDMRQSKIVKLLLDRGADVNQKDSEGWTPLMYALDSNLNFEISEELLRRNAEVNARAINGDTALTIAVDRAQGRIRMVEQLLRKGADVTVKDKFGRTPLMIAEEHEGMNYIIDLLKQAGNKK